MERECWSRFNLAALKSTRMNPVPGKFFPKEELNETALLLKNVPSQSYATSLCKAWVEQREKSIETIDGLEKRFDKVHRACTAAHGVGAAMEVVGGLAMVAGAVLTVCGHKAVGEFLTKKVSPVTVGTGVATTVSSSVADLGLTLSTIYEVKKVLKKDEEYTQKFEEILQFSRKIDAHLRKVFNCSVLSDIFLLVVRLVREGISLLEIGYEKFSKLWSDLKMRALKCSDISEYTETILKNVCVTMKKISTDPNAQRDVKNICNIIQQSPSTVEFIKLGLRVSIMICDVLNVDVFTPLLGLGVMCCTGTGVMATHCLMGSVLVATNVISAISAAKNAKEESSKYSKMLKELNMALSMELNTVRKDYSKYLQ